MIGAPAGATIGISTLFWLTTEMPADDTVLAAFGAAVAILFVLLLDARSTGFRAVRWPPAATTISILASGLSALAFARGDRRASWL